MEFERIVARRFLYDDSGKLLPVVRISVIGIALGVSLILLSLFVVSGFKKEIDSKLNNFVGTVRISNPLNVYNRYALPLEVSDDARRDILAGSQTLFPEATVNTFIDEMALVKVDSSFRTVMMHGIGRDFNRSFYQQYLVQGEVPETFAPDDVLLSQKIADYLELKVGDHFVAYYQYGNSFKVRRYLLRGVINTGFDHIDDHIAVSDLSALQGVKGWSENEVGGVTVTVNSRKDAHRLYDALFEVLAERNDKYGERYTMFTVEELNYNFFAWLELLDANVILILVLMIAVAVMTIITGLVVLVLQKVRAIATLKGLGMTNRRIQNIFRSMAVSILIRGIVVADILALTLALLQKTYRIIPLDQSQYYMSYVPIHIDIVAVLLTNIIVFGIVFLFILVPTGVVSSVHPSRILRFN